MDSLVTEQRPLTAGRWKVFLLLCLSAADALATDTGIRLGIITESNPFMATIYEGSRLTFYVVKLVGPFLLMVLWSSCRQSLAVRRMLAAALILYGSVILLHGWWIALSLLPLT